jgi:hypothetical protein
MAASKRGRGALDIPFPGGFDPAIATAGSA